MTTVEDRLTAALAARAEQVQVEDLRPPALPDRSKTWVRRPATYLAAAAACAAAVAAPFVVAGDDEAPPEHGPATQPADPGPAQDTRTPGQWPDVLTASADMDGDGTADHVHFRSRPGKSRLALDAELSSDGVARGTLPQPQIDLRVWPVDADGDGDQELVVGNYIGTREARMIDLVDGELEAVVQPHDPPLTSAFTREGRVQRWWLDAGALYSSRSVEVLAESDHYVPLPKEYAVELWTWSLEQGALVPEDLGTRCVRSGAPERPFPCAGD